MKKVITASFAASLLLLVLAGLQLGTRAQEPDQQETPAPTEQETPAPTEQETPASTEQAPSIRAEFGADLTIASVTERGNRARVRIRNIGGGGAPQNSLVVYRRNNGNWFVNGRATVPSLAAGASTTVTIDGAGASPSLYYVDARNAVQEQRENNNFGFVP